MKKFFTLICFAFLALNVDAQSVKAYEKSGDEALAKHEYYNAMHHYEQVLKSKPSASMYYKYAEACRQAYDYAKAQEAYEKVLKSPEHSTFPLLGYHYATVLKHNGKYREAAQEFNRFAQSYPTDDFYRKKALYEAGACFIALEITKRPIDTVVVERLGDNINSEYSDFGAHKVGDSAFYYSSLRFVYQPETKKKNKDTDKRFVSKIMSAPDEKLDKGEAMETFNDESRHTANSALSLDGKRLYFTYCTGNRSDSIKCELYVSRLQANGSWGNPTRLPEPINLPGFTTTQPNIGYDSLKKKEILFFASDRTGGQGRMDIWYVSIKDSTHYGDVINIGAPINTIDDEGTPYFDTKHQIFYFSSCWHAGLGGYDIFKTRRKEYVWQDPVNLGVPYNSAANDLYYLKNVGDTTGYFASNRSGSSAIIGESCCNDIYAYTVKSKKTPVTTTVVVVKPPVDTTTYVVNNNPPDNPNTTTTTTTKTTPDNPNTTTTTTKTTPDNPNTTTTTTTTTTKTNPNDPFGTPIVMNTPNEQEVDKMIEELNKMLPLSLYFHNDEPDSNTTSRHTDKPYELTYNHYVSLQEQYMEGHSAQFDVEKQPLAQVKVRDFFEGEVKGEYNRMNAFFDKLLELLDAGVKLEIYIKGYTSPRSPEGYNDALAQRRITSVRKQLFIYKKGIFLQHFQNKRFWVHEVPLGERTAPKGISDEIEDPANSIYSVEASKERRAEIIVLQKMK